MRIIGLFVFLICFFSCAQIEPREPLNKQRTIFLNSSALRNKQLLINEERLLMESAAKDSLLDFEKSEGGYLFAYKQKAVMETPYPQKGDQVRFQYQIEDLQKNIIYDKKSLGTVKYAIDEEELLPALREALRIMRPNEVAVFLFPSYLCYSYQGDGDKIGINQPLRFTIERLKSP
ncbi:gliding motility-associated peptidyl-prolyl isomerase GldI [Flavobacteriaceae bacterium]|nr:gliding motility-associated peptidyl-prolyl isomerase GldI [Flavobacteriaceae bacterium]MDA9015832.1 gliding motility-associated peptidyl-prolyl isomerase GldI [Flavobacteriaceae bacterium]MDB3862825.1 gliding motility-associated peptidyl-prolyl isomerase GldI [Flavobacteriaceae bacterium]